MKGWIIYPSYYKCVHTISIQKNERECPRLMVGIDEIIIVGSDGVIPISFVHFQELRSLIRNDMTEYEMSELVDSITEDMISDYDIVIGLPDKITDSVYTVTQVNDGISVKVNMREIEIHQYDRETPIIQYDTMYMQGCYGVTNATTQQLMRMLLTYMSILDGNPSSVVKRLVRG